MGTGTTLDSDTKLFDNNSTDMGEDNLSEFADEYPNSQERYIVSNTVDNNITFHEVADRRENAQKCVWGDATITLQRTNNIISSKTMIMHV